MPEFLLGLVPLDTGDYSWPLPDTHEILVGVKEMVAAFGPWIGMFAIVGIGLMVVGSLIGYLRG